MATGLSNASGLSATGSSLILDASGLASAGGLSTGAGLGGGGGGLGVYDFYFMGGTLPSGATLLRASTATYFDGAGVMRLAAIDEARFDYKWPPVLRGLLNEAATTNLVRQSNVTLNAPFDFAATGSTMSPGAALALDKTLTAARITEDDQGPVTHGMTASPSFSASYVAVVGATYTWSIFARAGERTVFRVGFSGGFTSLPLVEFNLTTPAATILAAATAASITPFDDGWYKCTMSAVATTAVAPTLALHFIVGGNNQYLGDGFSGLWWWGAQFEQAALPSSYVPTPAAVAVTRAVDTLTLMPPPGDYSVAIVRESGTTTVPSVAVTGAGYVVPNSVSPVVRVTFSGLLSSLAAWEAAVIANGGTVSAGRKTLVGQFIDAEKAAGTWDRTDDYWALWGENPQQALTSLKQHRLAVAINDPVFVPNVGYDFAGDLIFPPPVIDTGFIAGTHSVFTLPEDARLGVYEQNASAAKYGRSMGFNFGFGAAMAIGPDHSGNIVNEIMVGGNYCGSVVSGQGYTVAYRNGPSAPTSWGAYKNGIFTANIPTVSAPQPTYPGGNSIYFGGLKQDGAGAITSPRTSLVSFGLIGGALTPAQELAQYNNIQAWATAIGAQV